MMNKESITNTNIRQKRRVNQNTKVKEGNTFKLSNIILLINYIIYIYIHDTLDKSGSSMLNQLCILDYCL